MHDTKVDIRHIFQRAEGSNGEHKGQAFGDRSGGVFFYDPEVLKKYSVTHLFHSPMTNS